MVAGIEWDARAELHVALFIERYLTEQPPHGDSAVAHDLAEWAARLREDGESRLSVLGARLLVVA